MKGLITLCDVLSDLAVSIVVVAVLVTIGFYVYSSPVGIVDKVTAILCVFWVLFVLVFNHVRYSRAYKDKK